MMRMATTKRCQDDLQLEGDEAAEELSPIPDEHNVGQAGQLLLNLVTSSSIIIMVVRVNIMIISMMTRANTMSSMMKGGTFSPPAVISISLILSEHCLLNITHCFNIVLKCTTLGAPVGADQSKEI